MKITAPVVYRSLPFRKSNDISVTKHWDMTDKIIIIKKTEYNNNVRTGNSDPKLYIQ